MLDIMRVEEILPPQRVIPVPHAPSFVEGMLHLRGALLPVVDLRQRLSTSEAGAASEDRGCWCACWAAAPVGAEGGSGDGGDAGAPQ